ncbi:MAG: M24 family metallopeptidase [Planctomycetota bacterium]
MPDTEKRLSRLRERFPENGIQGFYTEDPINILYGTGFFAPESALLVAPDVKIFITDFRTLEEATQRLPGFTLAEVDQGAGTVREACRRVSALGVDRLGFESHLLPYRTGEILRERLGPEGIVPTTGLVESLRMQKDEKEVQAIESALRAAESAFQTLRSEIRPGQTEKEIADRLESLLRQAGARKGAFDACVLAGEGAAHPHGMPTATRRWREDEGLLLDFGAFREGYHCDLTRMVYAQPPGSPQAEIHGLVHEAQQKAIASIRPGVPAKAVDRVARDVIEGAGYGNAFRHGLGHGVGLQVHEAPRISWLGEAVLSPGHVFTVEPGIYLPGVGGVRIEDMVLVTEEGVRTLSTLPSSVEASLLG